MGVDQQAERDATAQGMADLGMQLEGCRGLFTALGDENRQLILMELLKHYGGMRVGELSEVVCLSRATVSHHLKILQQAGMVDRYSVGTKNFYHVSADLASWRKLSCLANHTEAFVGQWLERRSQGMVPPYREE